MKKKKQAKKSVKMTSFQLFRDKNAKDWKESLGEISDFLKKNRQWILIFLLGLATFPILFFLSVSLKEATTGLIRKITASSLTVRSSTFSTPIPTRKLVVSPTPIVNISPAEN